MSNPITTENANTGTTAWKPNNIATTQIAMYVGATAVNAGGSLNIYVSTQSAGTTYTINIYRIGYYGGKGGCLKQTVAGNVGVAQGYYQASDQSMHNFTTSYYDSTTHLTEAQWASSYTWSVPGNACTGIYTAQVIDQNNYEWNAAFIVRGNTTADYAYMHSFNTDNAYNSWGGYSLYSSTRATKVSFVRPNNIYGGCGGTLFYEAAGIKWLESQGYNLSYISDMDVHLNASTLLTYKAILVAGHSEYWTKAMRDGFESAIAANVSMAFLGANASYWQARIENDSLGNANQTVVCYKVLSPSYSADPQYGVNNAIVTSQWRDALLNRPENTMIGIMFKDYNGTSDGVGGVTLFAWTTDASMNTSYTAGTGLAANTSYGADLVGNEWDAIFSGGPANLKTIATSAPTNGSSQVSTQNTTTYIAPSGALVFATGSLAWTWTLDNYRWTQSSFPVPIAGMQVLLANIMGALKGPVYGNLGGH